MSPLSKIKQSSNLLSLPLPTFPSFTLERDKAKMTRTAHKPKQKSRRKADARADKIRKETKSKEMKVPLDPRLLATIVRKRPYHVQGLQTNTMMEILLRDYSEDVPKKVKLNEDKMLDVNLQQRDPREFM